MYTISNKQKNKFHFPKVLTGIRDTHEGYLMITEWINVKPLGNDLYKGSNGLTKHFAAISDICKFFENSKPFDLDKTLPKEISKKHLSPPYIFPVLQNKFKSILNSKYFRLKQDRILVEYLFKELEKLINVYTLTP